METEGEDSPGLEQVGELIEYLRGRSADIGDLLAQRYREEIVEYRSLPEGFIEQDIAPTARRNLEEMLSGILDDGADGHARLDVFRDSAIRRFKQGVPIQALLHAYRLWGQVVWNEVRIAPQTRRDPQVALTIAGRIMKHVDLVSSAVAQAYLQEASGLVRDREALRRNLIESLIEGHVSERIVRDASVFGLVNGQRYIVFLLRRHRATAGNQPGEIRGPLEAVRKFFRDHGPAEFLASVRLEEIVVIAAAGKAFAKNIREQAHALADQLPGFVLGVSRPHENLTGVQRGYRDAQEAMVSASTDVSARAHFFVDAILDQIVRTSSLREALHEETLAPLIDYDAKHQGDLVETLVAYIQSGARLATAAQSLHVQANTVKYRLRRIHEITDHDPLQMDDLLLFALGIRSLE